MKKLLIIISSILLVVCFLFPKNEEIRIRIISNSDSEEDLEYKGQVVEFFKDKIIPNISLTEEFLEDNVSLIQKMFDEEFEGVKVSYEPHTFTNKTYNSNAAPNGKYHTLVIRIGNASGNNWWASIFDGLIINESTDEVEYRFWIKEILG